MVGNVGSSSSWLSRVAFSSWQLVLAISSNTLVSNFRCNETRRCWRGQLATDYGLCLYVYCYMFHSKSVQYGSWVAQVYSTCTRSKAYLTNGTVVLEDTVQYIMYSLRRLLYRYRAWRSKIQGKLWRQRSMLIVVVQINNADLPKKGFKLMNKYFISPVRSFYNGAIPPQITLVIGVLVFVKHKKIVLVLHILQGWSASLVSLIVYDFPLLNASQLQRVLVACSLQRSSHREVRWVLSMLPRLIIEILFMYSSTIYMYCVLLLYLLVPDIR